MSKLINRQFQLASRPAGEPEVANFKLVETAVADLTDGQVLLRNHYLSLDPYMRWRMNDAKSYAAPQALNEVMVGGTVGEVVASKSPLFKVGDTVRGGGGWQLYRMFEAAQLGLLQKVDTTRIPLSAYLGAVGMPGVTAWYGLVKIIHPKAGETVVVSAASGAVGSVVGQLAKARGARVVGIAGGADKCRYVVDELGFDACIDYKGGRLVEDLKAATPGGVDVYFDNVGGPILDAVLGRMNPFSRLPLCGLISQYNATEAYGVKNFRSILVNRIRVQGFIVFDFQSDYREAMGELAGWLAAGQLRYRETIAQGLRAAPAAFVGMLRGDNLGKQLVKLA